MTARYLVGDVFNRMAELPDSSVDLVMTSPPFLALRSYLPDGHPDKVKEIGSEPTPAEFIDTLLALTAEWRRVLAPHGSICVELGDTYAGSGGAGGDYGPEGMRGGQTKFKGSALADRKNKVLRADGNRLQQGPGWPMEKSLTGIPTLYAWSLAYGRNLLRRPLSAREFMERVEAAAAEIPDITVPELLVLMRDLLAVWEEPGPSIGIEPWRIRNLVAWVRPNPPVGALGDKFRPATSYLTVATVARDRWFDLDAVRTPHTEPSRAHRRDIINKGAPGYHTGDDTTPRPIQNPAGAPPLDWWEIPPGGYSGAHYAVYPPELCRRPIDAMCPRRVCTTCGTPSRRNTEPDASYLAEKAKKHVYDSRERLGISGSTFTASHTTTGWSSCGCPGTGGVRLDGFHTGAGWRPGHVLDPFGGSGTTAVVATGLGRTCTLIDIDERNADLARQRLGMFLDVDHIPAGAA